LQYLRLYDDKGNFRSEVGARAIAPSPDPNVRKRRVSGTGEE
jgi:hypothetical protein